MLYETPRKPRSLEETVIFLWHAVFGVLEAY